MALALLVGDREGRIHRIDTQTATVTGIIELGATPSWPDHPQTTTDHLWFLQPGGIAPDPLARVPLEAVLHTGDNQRHDALQEASGRQRR